MDFLPICCQATPHPTSQIALHQRDERIRHENHWLLPVHSVQVREFHRPFRRAPPNAQRQLTTEASETLRNNLREVSRPQFRRTTLSLQT
jgi:hypothetical protein